MTRSFHRNRLDIIARRAHVPARPLWRDGPVQAAGRSLPTDYAKQGKIHLAYLLAALPFLDVVLSQVQAILDPQVGPLSFAQIWHGCILVVMGGILAARLRSFPRVNRFVLFAAVGFASSIAVSLGLRFSDKQLLLEDLVAGFQVGYWLVIWAVVFVVCRTGKDRRIVLFGIAAAGVYASLSIVYLYVTGGVTSSHYENITASAGGLKTAKGLTGMLITAGLSAVWLSRSRFKLLGMAAFAFCLAGLFLTYQRAGLVAMSLAMLWFALWYIAKGRKRPDSAWGVRLLSAAVAAIVVILAIIGTSDLRERWKDLPDPEKAGSARISFWTVALEHYGSLRLSEKLFGIGYSGVAEAMEDEYGSRIHTHSDLLDALGMFGIVGLVFWGIVHVAIVKTIVRSRSNPSAFAVSLGVYIVMLSEGLLTGQIFGPHVMGMYLMAIVCISQYAQTEPRTPTVASRTRYRVGVLGSPGRR